MKSAAKHPDEEKRLESLRLLNILDTLPEKDFDDVTRLAAQICETPIAWITLVDEKRQWFKSKIGLMAKETKREVAVCAHTILQNGIFLVPDLALDEKFSDNPMVVNEPHIRFYAAAPLISPEGYPIGTVCVADSKPRKLKENQIEALKALSGQVSRLLDLKAQFAKTRAAESKLEIKRTAVENISEGVVMQNENGVIVDYNTSALRILGLTAEELVGRTSNEAIWNAVDENETNLSSQLHPASLALSTGVEQKNSVIGIHNSRHEFRWLQVNAVPLFQRQPGKPSGVVVSFGDITSEVNARKTIAANQRTLEAMLDGIPAMVAHWSKDLVNIHANKEYLKFHGVKMSDLKGRHMSESLSAEWFQGSAHYIDGVLSGRVQTYEKDITYKDGSLWQAVISYVPTFEGDSVVSFFVIAMDITTVKKTEKQRHQLLVQLSESSRLSTLGEMAGGMAHEINTPLAIIQGKANILKRKIANGTVTLEQQLKDLQTIDNTVERIANIIRSLRAFSRDAKDDPIEATKFAKVLEDSIGLCRERFASQGIEFRVGCDEAIKIDCRSAQISQVITHLLHNAYEAIIDKNDKWIAISVKSEAKFIEISVSDSGAGIAPEVVAKMMQPFFTTKAIGKGPGLGLSISKGVIEDHGGAFWYDPTASNTTFIMTLPYKHPQTEDRAAS